MFPEEGDQLCAGPVYGEIFRLHPLPRQHRPEQQRAATRPLPTAQSRS